MKKKVIFFVLIICGLTILHAQTELFVSTLGDDTIGDGTQQNPFKTIEACKNYIRTLTRNQNITVNILEGTYFLDSTLCFNSQDGGVGEAVITYKAFESQDVTISGGLAIPSDKWELCSLSNCFKADLSDLDIPSDGFRELYYLGNKAVRARRDVNNEHFRHINNLEYQYEENEIGDLSELARPMDVEVVRADKWVLQRLKTDRLTNNSIYLKGPIISENEMNYKVLFLENAPEFIDELFEWYYNPENQSLYFRLDENPGSQVIVPLLEQIVFCDGVQNLRFENLTFSHSTWQYPNGNNLMSKQASVYFVWKEFNDKWKWDWNKLIPASFKIQKSENIKINKCKFELIGSEGLSIGQLTKKITIENNVFKNISAGAINIADIGLIWDHYEKDGTTKDPIDPNIVPQDIQINNNYINDVANEYFSSAGIFLTYAQNVTISENIISNIPYSGISTGYSWTNYETPLGNIVVRNNYISNVLQKMSDGGAIYNLGAHNPQSLISNNEIVNIPSHDWIRSSIYLDEGSNNLVVEDNFGTGTDPFEDYTWNNIFCNYNYPCEGKDNVFQRNDFDNGYDHWVSVKEYKPQEYHIGADCCGGDMGVRFIDVDHDGLKDMLYHRWLYTGEIQRSVFMNTGKGWSNRIDDGPYQLPYHIVGDIYGDFNVQIVDFDNDGFEDLLYCREGYSDQCKAFRNTGSGWQYTSKYVPPIAHYKSGIGDLGVRYVDVNHDSFPDLLQYRYISPDSIERRCFINTPDEPYAWVESFKSSFMLPYHISADGIGDLNSQFVDLDGDGFKDMIYSRFGYEDQKGAFISTGSGWRYESKYVPKYWMCSQGSGRDLGVRFVDLNHDGLKDFVYKRDIFGTTESNVYLNDSLLGWVKSYNSDYNLPTYTAIDGIENTGFRLVDLNGDGFDDIVKSIYISSNGEIVSEAYLNGSFNYACSSNLKNTQSEAPKINAEELKLESNGLKLYPNPTTGIVHILSNDISNLKIYDLKGTLLKTYIFENSEVNDFIDISNFKTGLYIVRFTTKESAITRRLMKH